MHVDAFLRQFGEELQRNSPYEVVFVQKALALVADLDFANVSIQTQFRDDWGRPRRIDFTIVESPRIRLAIEIDGYNKDGAHPGMSREQFVDWQRRERAIVRQGWRLLRFANSEIQRDPRGCARSIELTLRGLRTEAHEYAEAAEARRLRGHLSSLQQKLLVAEQQVQESSDRIRRIEEDALVANRRVQDLQEALHRAHDAGDIRLRDEAQNSLAQAESRAAAVQRELDVQTDALARARQDGVAVARGPEAAVETTELERLREAQDAAVRRFELELQAAAEGRLAAEELTAIEQRSRAEENQARLDAERALRALGKENRGLKIAIVSVAIVVVAAFGTILFIVRNSEPAPTTPPNLVSPSSSSIEVERITDPVRAGDDMFLRVAVEPGAECELTYATPAGTQSAAQGIAPKTANAAGNIEWTWRIGSSTAPGEGTLDVTCGETRLEESFFIVR